MRHAVRRSGNMSFRNDTKDAQGLCAAGERCGKKGETTAAARGGHPMVVPAVRPVLCLCLTLAWGAQAAEPDEARRPAEGSGAPTTAEQVKKTEKKAPPPRPFVPTEKIKADSAISFPVDI